MRTCLALFCILLCSHSLAQLRLEDATVRGLPPGQTVTAGFGLLVNEGREDVVLVSASSAVAERVEIHAHEQVDGMMRMTRVAQVVVPAEGSFRFAPGSFHLMLIGLKRPLVEAEDVVVTLVSDAGLEYAATFTVVSVLKEQHQSHAHH